MWFFLSQFLCCSLSLTHTHSHLVTSLFPSFSASSFLTHPNLQSWGQLSASSRASPAPHTNVGLQGCISPSVPLSFTGLHTAKPASSLPFFSLCLGSCPSYLPSSLHPSSAIPLLKCTHTFPLVSCAHLQLQELQLQLPRCHSPPPTLEK